MTEPTQMLTLTELCAWLKITERHARKLVERGDIPYRKIGRLLRFSEADVIQWSIPPPTKPSATLTEAPSVQPPGSARPRRSRRRHSLQLPNSLLD
jgi:excisionase family DNA binding protein